MMHLELMLSIACTCTLITILLLLVWKRRSLCLRSLPPGNMGLPIVGEMLNMMIDLEGFYEQRFRRYGEVFKTRISGSATIVSMNAELNKFVLLNDGITFISNFPETIESIFGKWNMSKLSGAQHKRRRGIVHGFSRMNAANQNFLLCKIEAITTEHLSFWNDDRILDLQDETEDITFAIICNILIGMVAKEETNNLKKDFSELQGGIFSLGYNIPGTAFWKAMQARKRIIEKLQAIMQKRQSTETSYPREDVLDYHGLLAVETETSNIDDKSDNLYKKDEILDFVMGILFAAYGTTGTTMTMAVKFLTRNCRALEEIRNEHLWIRKGKQTGETLTWKDYENMTFTKNVIQETLRLSNPTPILHRKATKNVNFKGITILKGWKILIHNEAAHKNSCAYSEPSKFDPWRWKNKTGKDYYFAPFGHGIRYCPGSDLAKLQIAVFLHHLVTQYSWELKEGKKRMYHLNMIKKPAIYVIARKP